MRNHFSNKFSKIRFSILIAAISLTFLSCSSDKPNTAPSTAATVEDNRGIVVEGGDSETVVTNENVVEGEVKNSPMDAFKLTTHDFVIEKCGGCHGKTNTPFFASDNIDLAFEELYVGQKIDVLKLEKSRLILRLDPEQHYCWDADCVKSAAEMKAKLTDWVAEITDGTIEALKADAVRFSTPGQLLADTVTIDNPDIGKNPQEFLFEAEKGTMTGLTLVDDETVSGAKFLEVTTANTGTIQFSFEVTEPGTYGMFGLSSNETNNNQDINITFDGGANIRWRAGVTGADAWAWSKGGRDGQDQLEIALAAGLHTLDIAASDINFKLDAVAITTNLEFTSADIPSEQVTILKFDLSKTQDATIPAGVTFEIQVMVYDELSYILKNPAIYLPSGSVDVKGIKILLNGTWDPQNATYMYIDETITAPGKILATAPMLMPIELSPTEDLISVQFEAIK